MVMSNLGYPGMGPVNDASLTVVLTTYNRAGSFLAETVRAILDQTYRDFEFLILDNGSTDHTADLILAIDDPRIRYVRNPKGSSLEFNNVSAFHIPTGDRIIVTHDDDIMERTMLEEQMNFMNKHPEVKLVFTSTRRINEDGHEIEPEREYTGIETVFAPGEYVERLLLERLWVWPSTVMFERRLTPSDYFTAHYHKPTHCHSSQTASLSLGDIELPIRINRGHSIALIDRPLLRYRVHTKQDTKSVDLLQQPIDLYRRLRREALDVPGRIFDLSMFDCFILKYQLQKALCENEEPVPTPETQKRLREIHRQTFNASNSPEALTIALPVYIAAKLALAPSSFPDTECYLPFPSGQIPSSPAFHRWAAAVDKGQSLFASLPRGSRIVIFGSVLVASLLILDAHFHGVDIICCVDSNAHRRERSLFGIPVNPLSWLSESSERFDFVVLTSEFYSDAYQRRILNDIAGTTVPAISWKQLSEEVITRQTRSRATVATFVE